MNGPQLASRVRGLLDAGDADAAATLVIESLGPAVLGLLSSLHGEDDAQDAFSLFAESVWQGLPAFRWECSLRAWSFGLARHASHRLWRDPWRVRKERLRTSAASRLAASITRAGGRERADDRLGALCDGLDPDDRLLLTLRLNHRELTWDEIAASFAPEGEEVRPEALRKRFQRLKRRLGAVAREKGLLP